MTLKELVALFETIAPTAYLKFKKDQELPYMAYGFSARADFYADNTPCGKSYKVWLELYNKYPDFDIQSKIDKIFEDNYIPYTWAGQEYLPDEKMCVCVWRFEFTEGDEE